MVALVEAAALVMGDLRTVSYNDENCCVGCGLLGES